MKQHLDDHLPLYFTIAIGIALVALLAWLIPVMNAQHQAWVDDCTAKGGHVEDVTKTSTGTGINPSNGQPVVVTGSETTYYCLSEDGRILAIK